MSNLRDRMKKGRPVLSPFIAKPRNDVSPDSMWQMLQDMSTQFVNEKMKIIEQRLEKRAKDRDAEMQLAIANLRKTIPVLKKKTEDEVSEHIRSRTIEIRGEKGDSVAGPPGPQGEPGKTIVGPPGLPGKDADPEKVVPLVLKKIPKVPELKPDAVVEKVNNAKKKVKLQQIEGLDEVLRGFSRKDRGGGGGGGGMGNIIHQHTATSSATTTVSTANKISGGGFAIWAYYNGSFMARGTDYTVGGDLKTLTLTFTPQDDTVIDLVYIRG